MPTMEAPGLAFPRPVFAKLSPHPYLLRNLQQQSPTTTTTTARTSDDDDDDNDNDTQTQTYIPTRANGRSPREARPVQVHTSSLSHAHGSAVVRTGDTTVICGVRGEVLPVERIPQFRRGRVSFEEKDGDGDVEKEEEEIKNYDLLVPNIELATGCAPLFLPGVPPSTLAQSLSTRVYSLLVSGGRVVDVGDLRIWKTSSAGVEEKGKGKGKGKRGVEGGDDDGMELDREGEEEDGEKPELVGYWVLYIDLLFVSFDGNPFDPAWTALMAALRDTKLPVARWDVDREAVVCSRTERKPLNIRGLPLACTAAVFLEKEYGEPGEGRHWILLDPDRLEESLCREAITMVVDCSSGETRLRAIEKHGGTVVGRELIRGYAAVAERRWREVRKAMD